MKPSPIMVRRVEAAQKTLDHFKGKPFVWGSADCSRIVAFHLRQMGISPGLARFGSYRSALGAKRSLKRAGFDTLAEVLDAILLRITPAEAIVGDIVQGEGTDAFAAFGVDLGGGAMIGFEEDTPVATTLRRIKLANAWSVG